jgi:type IV pilus assembly protein PilQ
MRKQTLAMILMLLLVVQTAASWAQEKSATTQETTQHVVLRNVQVIRAADGLEVAITSNVPVVPHTQAITGPPRLVVDLPNTVPARPMRRIPVDQDGVKAVRTGTDAGVPPTTRVVVDLDQEREYSVTSSGNLLVLKLHGKPSAALDAPKPVASAPAVQTAAVTPQPAKPAAAPSVRAIEAAAKFAEHPLQGLMTAPSALMSPDAQGKAEPAVNLAAEQKTQMATKPAANGQKYTGEPISVNLKDVDLKDFFRLIHEISGLNVVLDPNVKGSLTLVLDDVPWDQALDIVLKNNDLARQLEGNVLRIATVETLKKEAESRHSQQEAEALAVEKVTVTRFLSYARAKDAVATLKKFLSQRGDIISDERTNAVIISDIPSVIPQLDKLLTQLDRKTQEVEIEARVVAATRSFARDIGTQLGFGFGNAGAAIGGAPGVGPTPTATFGLTPLYPIIGTTVPGPTTGVQIPLFSNLGVPNPTSGLSFTSASNSVRVDAILSMAESRGLLKILSRPRIVTQNNALAVVKQGIRVPVVTQSQLSGPPTVTYVDAVLRLTVTPQITSEGTIFLNVDVENTTPDFGRTVLNNPTLLTQQATTQVLVADGGTVVVGGVIQTQNNMNVQQVPLLGNIPMLGNLFKRRTVSTSNQELIFFLTPRIVQT